MHVASNRSSELLYRHDGRTMKIAVIAHIRHAIMRPFMGGMELHCHALVEGLTRHGHQVTLFAAGESDISGFHSISAQPYEAVLRWDIWRGTPELAAYQERAFRQAWDEVLGRGYDVVHNNSLFPDLLDWARRDGVAMVTSQHVPPYPLMRAAVDRARGAPGQQITVTSAMQLAAWEAAQTVNMRVVHNGVDLSRWQVSDIVSDRLLWYGRITPNKGLREAVRAATAAGAALDIVGHVEDEAYFDAEVSPALGEAIRYLGQQSGPQLAATVAAARAVVITPLWDEPFGLVAAEAMACDRPVIAFDRGALAEVVGTCGTLVPAGDVPALAQAMTAPPQLQAGVCRARAVERFSIDAMISGYVQCYTAAMASAAAEASNSSSTDALLA